MYAKIAVIASILGSGGIAVLCASLAVVGVVESLASPTTEADCVVTVTPTTTDDEAIDRLVKCLVDRQPLEGR